MSVLKGETDPVEAVNAGKIVVEGRADKLELLKKHLMVEAPKKAAKKAPAKKTTTKTAVKTAEKTSTKKEPAKKEPVKKAPAKKTTK